MVDWNLVEFSNKQNCELARLKLREAQLLHLTESRQQLMQEFLSAQTLHSYLLIRKQRK
jgi:hypothetical protein